MQYQPYKSFIAKIGAALMAMSDIISIVLAFLFSMSLFNYFTDQALGETLSRLTYISPFERHYLYFFISSMVLLLFLSHGHYTQRIPWWNQIRLISVAVFMAMLCEGFGSFVLTVRSSPLLISLNWAMCFVFFICFRLLFFRLRSSFRKWDMKTVIIGDSSTTSDILYAFNADPSTGFGVHTVFLTDNHESFHLDDLPRKYSNLRVEHDLQDYEDYITNNPNNFYVIVLDAFKGIMRDKIVEALNAAKARYAVVPSVSRISLYEMEPRYFFGYDVMLLHAKPSLSHPLARLAKRLIDLTSSLAGLVVFSPLFAIIIISLKIERHKGSIFYGGERLGQNGKLFKCWKFRTMSPDSDHLLHDYLEKNPEAKAHWEKYLKLPRDPRVLTRTAHLLRKSSLDEIPQLWNVFIGNMSLVGPRPILPNEVDLYGDTISQYIKVKPGITGLWQVSGRNSMSFQRRIYWDGWYVRNWSLWGDIVIIIKTVPAVLFRNDGH